MVAASSSTTSHPAGALFQKRGTGALVVERADAFADPRATPAAPAGPGRGGTKGAGTRPGRAQKDVVEAAVWDRRGIQKRALMCAMSIFVDDAARKRVSMR